MAMVLNPATANPSGETEEELIEHQEAFQKDNNGVQERQASEDTVGGDDVSSHNKPYSGEKKVQLGAKAAAQRHDTCKWI